MIEQLKNYLDENHVPYTTIFHSRRFTARDIATGADIPGVDMVKAVMVKKDEELVMVVLPASCMVLFKKLEPALGAYTAELADRADFAHVFPECEPEAIPPFGNLYGIRVFMDAELAKSREIAFSSGDFSELIRISFTDYQRLVDPILITISRREKVGSSPRK